MESIYASEEGEQTEKVEDSVRIVQTGWGVEEERPREENRVRAG